MPVTTRLASLSSDDNAPTFPVGYTHQRWNGNPIVITTVDALDAHVAALAASDPNGTWANLGFYVDDDNRVMMHDCERGYCSDLPDHEYGDDLPVGDADAHDFRDDIPVGETSSADVIVWNIAGLVIR
jgi:hypothetical protein